MNGLDVAMELIPQNWRGVAKRRAREETEEIRLRVGRAPSLVNGGKEIAFTEEHADEEILRRILEKATGASLHAAAPALSEGYLSYRGVRVGVCGTAVIRDGNLSGFRSISSLAIRVPRECRGICDKLIGEMCSDGFSNTLVIGRPGDGKTTVLREMIRLLSTREYRIGIADERNELAAADGAYAQFDLGPCSDYLTGVSKAEAAMMLLRGMNPQILAMDEVTQQDDLEALYQVCGCGVGLLASAHGSSLRELRGRKLYRDLLEQGLFTFALQINRHGAARTYSLERITA